MKGVGRMKAKSPGSLHWLQVCKVVGSEGGFGYAQALRASMPAGLSTSACRMSERDTTPRRCWVSSTSTNRCTCGSTGVQQGGGALLLWQPTRLAPRIRGHNLT